VVMNARAPPGPAKTMSRGSSPTRSVRTTLGTPGVERSMTLMLSDKMAAGDLGGNGTPRNPAADAIRKRIEGDMKR